MPDPVRLQQQHLARTLAVAEGSGDKAWAQQIRAELDEYEAAESKVSEAEDKAVERMNKDELVDLAVSLGVGTRDELDVFTKAEIREEIDNAKVSEDGN